MSVLSTSLPTYVLITLITLLHAALHVHICQTLLCTTCEQWCSGGGATGAIVPVPIFQGGAPLQFLVHFFLVNFAYILQKLAY